jgi:hypothetical protein
MAMLNNQRVYVYSSIYYTYTHMIVNVGKPNAINHPQVITISYGWDFNHPKW